MKKNLFAPPLRSTLLVVLFPVSLLSLLSNLLMLAAPLYSMQIFDRVLPSGHVETLWALTMMTIVALFVVGLLDATRQSILNQSGVWLDRHVLPKILQSSVDGHISGVREIKDIGSFRTFLSSTAFPSLVDLPWIPVFVFVSWLLHPVFGILAFLGSFGLLCSGILSELLVRNPLQEASELSANSTRRIQGLLLDTGSVRAMGILPGFLSSFEPDYTRSLIRQQHAADRLALIAGFSKFLRVTCQILVLACGAWLVLRQGLSSGATVAASILVSRALAPAEAAISAWRSFLTARSSWRRLQEGMMALSPCDGMKMPKLDGSLQVEGLAFHRSDGSVILEGIDFVLKSGRILAIVGLSGSGKSTLARLLVGAERPTRGRILFGGMDREIYRHEDLARWIGYSPQHPVLFEGTIGQNISRLSPVVDGQSVMKASCMIGMHPFITRIPGAYLAPVSGNGNILSGGQRQMISLARACYGDPNILVLDEPTNGLDASAESSLRQALLEIKSSGKTILLMTHSASLLALADDLLVLDQGRQRRFGPRSSMVAGEGRL